MSTLARGSGSLVLRPKQAFNAVKVFSATMFDQRAHLGDKVTEWLAANPAAKVTEFVLTQSSDAEFHCVAITVFYWAAPSN